MHSAVAGFAQEFNYDRNMTDRNMKTARIMHFFIFLSAIFLSLVIVCAKAVMAHG